METQLHEPETRPSTAEPETRLSTADLVNDGERITNGAERPAHMAAADGAVPLFVSDEAQKFRTRWEKIQIEFVDEPRKSVEQADELVAATIKRLAEVFAAERTKLEQEWGKGDDVSTEELRVALRRYRSFFDRLLSV